jgi:hypothetical protein
MTVGTMRRSNDLINAGDLMERSTSEVPDSPDAPQIPQGPLLVRFCHLKSCSDEAG